MSSKKVFMAFGQGKESSEGGVAFPKYVGVGAFNVVAVNPTKEELEKIYNTTLERDIEYVGKDDKGIDQVRLDFIVCTNPEKNNGIDLKTKVAFFLKNAPKMNAAGTKVQVINAYGETTWVDLELAKKGELPENQAWFETPYRPAYIGEEELTSFLKVFLNIPVKAWKDKNGNIKTIENKSDAEARLEGIPNYFKGNVKELKEIIKFQPDNLVKMAVGVKTTEDNKEYQAIYTKMFVKNNVKDYSKLDAAIKDSQTNGAYANTVFNTGELKEYVVTPTDFNSTAAPSSEASAMPGWFGNN